MNLYNNIIKLCNARGISGYRMCKDAGIQPSILTDLKMGRQKSLSAVNAEKVASYFGITVGMLLSDESDLVVIGDISDNSNNSETMKGSVISGSSVVIGDGKNIQSTVHNNGKEEELSSLEAGILEKVRKLSLEDQVKVFNFIMEMEGGNR